MLYVNGFTSKMCSCISCFSFSLLSVLSVALSLISCSTDTNKFFELSKEKTTPQIYIMQAVLIASLIVGKNFHTSFRFHLPHLTTFIDNWLVAIKHTVPTTSLRRAQCSFETLYHANGCWALTFLLLQTWIFFQMIILSALQSKM